MSDKDGVFDCEGGDLECEGHQWLACIIDKDPTDVVKYVGNLAVRVWWWWYWGP
jgi:hypothetical protein